jgi:hypothetical protein
MRAEHHTFPRDVGGMSTVSPKPWSVWFASATSTAWPSRSLYASSATRAVAVQQVNAQDFCSTPEDEARCMLEATNFLEAIGIPLGCQRPIQATAHGGGR